MTPLEASRKLLGLSTIEDTKKLQILTTHKHFDHSQGNVEIAKTHPFVELRVVGNIDDHVPGATEYLNFRQNPNQRILEVDVGIPGVRVVAINAPCHSVGSVMFYVETVSESISGQDEVAPQNPSENFVDCTGKLHSSPDTLHAKYHALKVVNDVRRCIFTGDTVFVGGCGKFFEGQAS